MKNVSILVLETAVIEAIADPNYMFKAVNQFLQVAGTVSYTHLDVYKRQGLSCCI